MLGAPSDGLGTTKVVIVGGVTWRALCSSWDVNRMDSSSRGALRERTPETRRVDAKVQDLA